MKKLFVFLFSLILSLHSFAQFQGMDPVPKAFNQVKIGKLFWIATEDTTSVSASSYPGAITFRSGDSAHYVSNGIRWIKLNTSAITTALDSARRSNDTLFFRTSDGSEIGVKMEGIKIVGVVGLQDSLNERYTKAQVDSKTLNAPTYAVVYDSISVFKRNDQASLVRLDNGNLLIGWTAYNAGSEDGNPAHIHGAISKDNGATWEQYRVLANNFDSIGIYVPSFYKRVNGNILMIVIGANSDTTRRFFKLESDDDGDTWGAPSVIHEVPGKYFVSGSDRIHKTNTGRLLFPFQENVRGGFNSQVGVYIGRILYSDDDGDTWDVMPYSIQSPDSLVAEPGIYQVGNSLTYYWRSRSGIVYAAVSADDGETFGSTFSTNLTAPNSQSTIRYDSVHEIIIAAHNSNNGIITGPAGRTELDVSWSKDGRIWGKAYSIERNSNRTYIEPSVFVTNGGVLIVYSDGTIDEENYLLKSSTISYNSLRYNSLPQGNTWINNQDTVSQIADIKISGNITASGGISTGAHTILASTLSPQLRLIRSEQTNQGLTITGGGGFASFHSYEGNNAVYGRFVFISSKGTDTLERARINNDGRFGVGTATPSALIHSNGSFAAKHTATSGNITLTDAHYVVRVTSTAHSVTLPAASSCRDRIYILCNYNTGGNVTISSVNHDGIAATILPDNAKWVVQSDGTAWYVIQD